MGVDGAAGTWASAGMRARARSARATAVWIFSLPGLRTCPKTWFEEGRLGWRSRGVSHPFAKNANGWGTERLWRVDSGQIRVFGQVLKGESSPQRRRPVAGDPET